MYAGDSFFTLTGAGQAGLVVLSGLISAGCIWIAVRMFRRLKATAFRVIAALVLFWLFVWISPQIYYLYYLLLFEGLPLQLVAGWPPGPVDIARMLLFSDQASLSSHAKAVLGWALIIISWKKCAPGLAKKLPEGSNLPQDQ